MASETPNVAPDDLDRLLTALLAPQVPNPFPAFRYSEPAVPSGLAAARNRTADSGVRARATLAASVALMVGTCWYLSAGAPGQPTPAQPGPGIHDGTADLKNTDLLKGIHKAGDHGPMSRP